MNDWSKERRLLQVDIPQMLLTKFVGIEGISRPFRFDLTMLSTNHNVSFEEIVGKKATVTIRLADGGERYFNGYVASFSQGRGGDEKGGLARFSSYKATIVPGFWLHTRVRNMRVFQKKDVMDIFEDILDEKGFQKFDDDAVDEDHPEREYCIQYRETDFDFLSRLLEEEGVYYFFKHEKGEHTMVLGDSIDGFKPCPGQEEANYQVSHGGWLDKDVITALEKAKEIRVGKYTLNDYDFRKPTVNLKVEQSTHYPLDPKPDKREIYDFSGRYVPDEKSELQRDEGERLNDLRMEGEEAKITTIRGTSVCRAFTSGYRFKLLRHYREDIDKKNYVLTEVAHVAEGVGEYTERPEQEKPEFDYINHFKCIPYDEDVCFRPPLVTPKPVVHGSETAIVVGPKNAKSYTDPDEKHPEHYGMVKIQFHWDREGQKDEKSSCWVRVAYPYAGEKHGAQFTPLIGDEVIVNFLQGDPDKPVVTGSLFKGQHKSMISQKRMIKNEILTPYGHRLHFDDKGGHITLNTGGGEVINMAEGKKDKTPYGNNINIKTADGHFVQLVNGTIVNGIRLATKGFHHMYLCDELEDPGIFLVSGEYGVNKLSMYETKAKTYLCATASLFIELDGMSEEIKITNEAGNVTIDALTKLTLKCGASSIELTPATITINGPMVKINS